MKKILIDNQEIEVPANFTLIQACEAAGIEVPRFCYHERLSVAGNCRMCLVEVKGAPKPQASCALNISDLRPGPNGELPEVFTNSETVKKAREGVMEFLLINHPLDCPICDQGGECDLQDQAMGYGGDKTRYNLNKRAIEDKNMGPLIKTVMNRCIHCTRCVRFSTEIAGSPEIGAIGRGEDTEITPYLENIVSSELSGNVIDLCPVGALTSKPYAFVARPWELKKTATIDAMDALGSAIRVDTRGREVMRIMPRINEDINEEWISNKTRFVFDGLKSQRLDKCYIRKNGKLQSASWQEALAYAAQKLKTAQADEIVAVAGDLVDVESAYALKMLMQSMNVKNLECRQDGVFYPKNNNAAYRFNSTIAGVEEADAILLIGTNPRLEAPVLNARLRKAWLNGTKIGLIGEQVDLTYQYEYFGQNASTISDFLNGKYNTFFEGVKKPLIIIGQSILQRQDGDAILSNAMQLTEKIQAIQTDWTGFSVLHQAAGRVGALEIDFLPENEQQSIETILQSVENNKTKLLYLLGADEIDFNRTKNAFIIYQGSHGDEGAKHADIILAGATYTEKNAIYMNTEGRVQYAASCHFPVGDAKEDWAIIRALSEVCGLKLPFDSLDALRENLFSVYPQFQYDNSLVKAEWKVYRTEKSIQNTAIKNNIEDFYMTNPIARASKTMAECSRLFVKKHVQHYQEKKTGTHG